MPGFGILTSVGLSKKLSGTKVGNWYNKQYNDWVIEDEGQTKLGENQGKNNKDKTPKKGTSASNADVRSRTNEYTLAYTAKDVPAAFTVDSTFSKQEGDISPNWPRGTEGDLGMLPYSMFNRYALYNFRGFYGGFSPSLADYYTDVDNKSSKFRGEELKSIETYDVTEQKNY